MKLKICCALVGASLSIAPSLFAQIGTGSLNITAPNYPPDQAGPYVVQISSVTSGPLHAGSTFQTFCVGSQVDYTPGTPYSYQISSTVAPSSVGTTFVTWGTAYLYSQFLAGSLGKDGNTATPASSAADLVINDALQAAIWDLQGQSLTGITFSTGNSTTLNTVDINQFLTDAANAASAAHISSDEINASGAFGVYALNMSSGGTPAQPELVMIPVPEPSTVFAGAMLLIPLGVSAVRAVRKQRKP